MNMFIIVLILLLVSILIENFSRNKIINNFIFKFNLILLFLIAALRYRISTDYFLYEKVYNNIKYLKDLRELDQIQMEKGFLYLNYFFAKQNIDFYILIILLHSILFLFLYMTLKKEENKNLGLFIYYCIYYLTNNFNFLRQGISEVIFLYSLKFIIDNKLKTYLLLNFFGLLFHRISFLAIIISKILKKKLKIATYILIILLSIIFSLFFIDAKIILFLNKNFNYLETIRRIHHYYFTKSNGVFGGNSLIGYLYRIILFIQALVLLKMKKNKESNVIIANLVIFSVAIYFLLSNVGMLAGRISKFYQCTSILLGVRLISGIENKMKKCLMIFFILFYSILFFVKELNAIHPETKEKMYYPYRSIFMKGEPKKWER